MRLSKDADIDQPKGIFTDFGMPVIYPTYNIGWQTQ
jgi:hypothetical protein